MKLLYQNFIFDYMGEHIRDIDGRKLEIFSIPVEIDKKGLCTYPVPFTLYEIDKENYPHLRAFFYGNQPFYTGASKEFTKEPLYEIPKIFEEYLKNIIEQNQIENEYDF